MFEKIIDASKEKQIVMFLDYNGTLSLIVANTNRAFMSKKLSMLLCTPDEKDSEKGSLIAIAKVNAENQKVKAK
ncbi:hypothetical protein GQ457_05G016140 [Hibiscus cannabinus]